MRTDRHGCCGVRCFPAVLLLMLSILVFSGCGDRLVKVRDLRRAGITAMENGAYEEAAEQFLHAMAYYGTAKQDSTGLDILRYLTEAQMLSGDYEAAAESCRKLLETDGRKTEYLNLLAVCLVRSGGDMSEALELYNEAGEKGDRSEAHLQALYSLGEAMSGSDDAELKERVFSLYQEAEERIGENAGLCLRIGKVCFEGGDYARAGEEFSRGIRLSEEEISQQEELAATGKGAKAEEALERWEELQRTLRELLFNDAVCLEFQGEYAEALEVFQRIASQYGPEEALDHEIAFLETRVNPQ